MLYLKNMVNGVSAILYKTLSGGRLRSVIDYGTVFDNELD